ncbi:MAG TPA: DUF58 domain-containing protein [Nitrososphaerales archaeon]|nr:DUF58 domain-containing protein [Nitrososphaerales archaeon]
MVIGPPLFIPLGFFLSIVAVETLVLLGYARLSSAIILPSRIRAFKNEKSAATLRLGSFRSKLVGSRRFVVVTPYGLECAVGEFRAGSGALTLEPSRAGRFENLALKLFDEDILGLFAMETLVPLNGFVLESLPSSLRAPSLPVLVSPISLGDIPAGRRGGGQELHMVEEYHPGLDAKDVIWRRVAQSPTEELVSRTRESSIRQAVTLGISFTWKSDESRVVLLDLAAEALGQITKPLLELGILVRISFVSQARISSFESSSLGELAEAILALTDIDNVGFTEEPISASDIVVAEKTSFFEDRRQALWRTGPVLLISETPAHPDFGDKVFVFTGREDLTALVEAVIET